MWKSGAWDWKPTIWKIGTVGKYVCAKNTVHVCVIEMLCHGSEGLSSQPMHTWITFVSGHTHTRTSTCFCLDDHNYTAYSEKIANTYVENI